MNESDISRMLEKEAERFEKEKNKGGSRRYFTPPLAAEPSQVYSVRIPVGRIEELRALAAREGKQPSAMIRAWILQRLDTELRQEAAGPSLISMTAVEGQIGISETHDTALRGQQQALEQAIDRIDSEIARRRSRASKMPARLHGRKSVAGRSQSGSSERE